MTRAELLSLAERLGRYGDNDRDKAAAILRKLAELRPVACVVQNAALQISMQSPDGGPFDMSKYVGAKFHQLSEVLADE